MPHDRGAPSPPSPLATLAAAAKQCNKTNGQCFSSSEKARVSLERQLGKPSASWTYFDGNGKPVGQVVRWDKPDGAKEIRPIARYPDGWRIGGMPEPRPLYCLPELAKADRVFVVEGEKAAEASVPSGS